MRATLRGSVSRRVSTASGLHFQWYSMGMSTSAKGASAGRDLLTDRHGRRHTYLRISLTERCNLRCVYCMPEEGVPLTPKPDLLTTDEIVHLATLFVRSGVDKIRLTGGEPTLRPDIESLVARLGALKASGLRTIGMTSNGLVLHRKLKSLHESGLDAVNISLDTLDASKFETIARRPGFPAVMRSIDEALRIGVRSLKVNCVVMRGVNDTELVDFVRWTKDAPLQVRFIEYMPFEGGGAWKDKKVMSMAQMIETIRARFPIMRLEGEDDINNTSKTYGVPGWPGRVGFISSMSDHFCSTCNRIRLLADGSLKACLFGASEVSLRDALRDTTNSDDDLGSIIHAAIQRKLPSHGGMYAIDQNKADNRPMILIGG